MRNPLYDLLAHSLHRCYYKRDRDGPTETVDWYDEGSSGRTNCPQFTTDRMMAELRHPDVPA